MEASPLHRRLREATRAAHHELDHHPLLQPLVREDITVAQYARALMALHGIYAALEAAVADRAAAAGFDYGPRRKVPAMEADLADLGQPALPCRSPIAAPAGTASLVGMLYTLEGSSLGAQVICRHLAKAWGRRLPLRYFSGYGEATPALWREFLAFAEAAVPPGEEGEAGEAAARTFRLIKAHLDEVAASSG